MLLSLIVFSNHAALFAQAKKAGTKVDRSFSSEVLKKLVAEYDSLLLSGKLTQKADELLQSDWTMQQIDQLFSVQDTLEQGDASIREIQIQQQNLLKDWGLGLNVGILNNFEQSLLDSEGRFYRRRYSSGLRWDLLSGGYVENRIQAKALDYRIQQIQLEQEKRAYEKSARVAYQQILYAFNKAKIRANEAFLSVLNEQIRLLKKQGNLGYDVREALRDATRRALRVQLQLEDYHAFEVTLDVVPSHIEEMLLKQALPLLEIDMDSYKQQRDSFSLIEPLSDLEAARNQSLNSIWRQLSFDLNTQYNYYDRVDDTGNNPFINDREFFSLTATLRAPLNLIWGNQQKELAKVSAQRFRQQMEQMESSDNNEIIGQFREFENRKRRILELQAELEVNDLRIKDQLNQLNISSRFAQPVVLFDLMNDRYLLLAERIFALEESYLTFFQIWIQSPQLKPSDFAKIKPTEDVLLNNDLTSTNQTASLHGFYLWSESMDRFTIDQVIYQFKSASAQRLALSAGNSMDNDRLNKLINWVEKCAENGIKTDLLVSNNNLVNENSNQSISDYINRALALGSDGLHLDIEPHTLDDYPENKANYLYKYAQLVALAAKLTKEVDLELSISIPTHYDTILSTLNLEVDRIYVMNYTGADLQKFKSKVQDELELLTDVELIWSLRTKDFTNKQELTAFINILKDEMLVQDVMIQDFSDFLQWENKELEHIK
jgi:hypothetical protein